MAVFHHFYNLAGGDFAALNSAMIVLLPKKDGATSMADYRPISLIHSIAKLIAKVLSMRLAPVISTLISPAQTAFQRTKCIHDSFLYVQNAVRALHRRKTPALLLKLDIAKAFDSISWEYMFELLQRMGFPARWRDWIALLLSTSSSSCLLNGSPGASIIHRRGLRQGDPLSPLLFILCIDPLHRLLEAATMAGQLSPLPDTAVRMRTSLYVDDAVIFINPARTEVDALLSILHLFGEATGLHVNLAKSSAVPISCGDLDLGSILHNFGGIVASLPITYLGLPITTSRVRLVHLQFILDRIRARLAGWKGRLMHIAGRRVLVRCVLSAMPTFALTVLRAPRKFFKEVDKARRRFLWAQDEAATGGKCKVAWSAVTTPEPHGGLGIHDLDKFARALRLRWLWLSWTHPERPWVGTGTPCNLQDRALFAANTAVTIGDGKTASFWSSPWLGGRPLRLDYPTLFARSIRKNRSVRDALLDGRWILDLRHGETSSIAPFVLQLARAIRRAGIIINNDLSDTIRWTAGTSGHYSARSAYAAQFQEPMAPFPSKDVWRIWAPGKLKMFLWMLHLDRLWCNDRLQRRGWENSYFCQLCLRNLESSSHLFWDCPIAIQAWTMAASWRGCHSLAHATWSSGTTTTERVRLITDAARPTDRKRTRSILALIAWHIWLERNACTFRGKTPCSRSIIEACRRDMEQWRIAGAACIEHPFGDVP